MGSQEPHLWLRLCFEGLTSEILSVTAALGYCRVGHGLSGVGTASVGQGVTSCGGCGFRARGVVLQPPGAAVGGVVILSWAVRKQPQSGAWARVTTRLSCGEPWAGARGSSRCSSRHRDWASPASQHRALLNQNRRRVCGSATERWAQVSLGRRARCPTLPGSGGVVTQGVG